MGHISDYHQKTLDRKVIYTEDQGHKRGYITMAAYLRAWIIYDACYHGQTADRIEQRGGFGSSELDAFYPEWRNHIIKTEQPITK